MKLTSLILTFVALFTYVFADGELTLYYCVGTDATSTCMVPGYEGSGCQTFGQLLDCKGGYGRTCLGCSATNSATISIYGPVINKWCTDRGGMTVTSARLRACNK